MNKLFVTAAALGVLAAAPAAAQAGYQGSYSGGYQPNASAGGGIQNRIAQLDSRFQAGLQSGAISREEARSLRPQLRQLRQLEQQYSYNGLTQQERQDLQQRIRSVRQQLRAADGGQGYANWDREDDAYGYNQGYGQGGYYGGNQGYGNQGYYGQGGPYDEVGEVCWSRGGISGLIGSLLGSDNCLDVGERAPSNLGAVPYQYRDEFRDGGGYYHRYVNGRVVQIDARTGTVVRIFDVD